ncbi:hypothetical protein [Diaphorobacter caeni]|uniref:hypothetical protein n=1 Tax=Diaphorobacter caeni TaxID=2784387 RepID=UPI00188FF2CC|nr:hypothetical protein [Diaphorobacter caeni]MBF5006377.1 hypothetical protein [Diaphorobacter caeni]
MQDIVDTTVDQEKIEGAMVAMREQAQEDQLELLELASNVGALQALELTRSFVAAATVQLFDKVRESKRIKDLPIRLPDGTVAMATTVDEFCRLVFGKPRTAMVEASESLQALGETAYELASRLGLNRNAMRAARALPPEKLEVVRLAISNGSTKADVLSVIEDLAEKVEESAKALEDAKADLVAKDQVLEDKNKSIDKLKAAQKRIQAASMDDQLADLKKEATALAADAEGAIVGGLRQALLALSRHGEIDSQNVFMSGLVGQVQAQLTALRGEFDLPDTSSAADQQLAAEHAAWNKTA